MHDEGNNIWGEPSFDESESFMLLTRFNTRDPDCWEPELLWSQGDVSAGFSEPRILN